MYSVISPKNCEDIAPWFEAPAADINLYLEELSAIHLGPFHSLNWRRELLTDFITQINANRIALIELIFDEVSKTGDGAIGRNWGHCVSALNR